MWILYGLAAALSFTGIFLVFKHLDLGGTPPIVSLTWVFIIAAVFYVGHNAITRQPVKVSGSAVLLLLLAGTLSYLGNMFQFKSVVSAPNPGYGVAVVSVQALLVTVASIFLFNSDFSILKGIGVFCCVCGVMLLSFG